MDWLEAGDPSQASQAFSRAIVQDPASSELWMWQARAMAELGDLEGAIGAAGQVLARRPDDALARYNRACWLARLGRLEEAAEDLERALQPGGIDRLTAARDLDLDPLRNDPRFREIVPQKRLPAWVLADEDALFVGSRWTVRIVAELPASSPELELSFEGEDSAPLKLVRIVEDRIATSSLLERRLDFIFEVLGEGEGYVGPWMLRGAELEAWLPAVKYRFLAPPGTAPVAGIPLAPWFQAPEERLGSLTQTGAIRLRDRVVVRGEPGDRLEAEVPPQLKLEVRRGGQPSWIAWELEPEPGSRVALLRAGSLVYEGNP